MANIKVVKLRDREGTPVSPLTALDSVYDTKDGQGLKKPLRTTLDNLTNSKADKGHTHDLNTVDITGTLPVDKGGTGATSLADVTVGKATSAELATSATSATYAERIGETGVTVGDANTLVHFENGVPVASNTKVEKSVPSDAKFTDTTYSEATNASAGLMSASDKKVMENITNNQTNGYVLKVKNSDTHELEWALDKNSSYTGSNGIKVVGTDIQHTNSIKAGTAGNNVTTTPNFGGSIVIPKLTFDAQGHLTGTEDQTITIPAKPKYGVSDITGLNKALEGKAPTEHKHGTADITDLQGKLDGKANSTHTHAQSEVSGLTSALASKITEPEGKSEGKVLKVLDAQGTIGWGTDNDTKYGLASGSSNGLMSSAHYTAVEGLDSKLAGKSDTGHTHTSDDITDFDTQMAKKANASHNHDASNITTGVLAVKQGGTGKSDLTQVKVGSATKADSATYADRLGASASETTFIGSADKPVYFKGGKPVACTHTVEADVPSNAQFTDTKYTAGANISISGTTISATDMRYTLPTASTLEKGGVKVGSNLSMSGEVLNAKDTTYADATTDTAGLMSSADKKKLDGIDVNANKYSLPQASGTQLGGVTVGENITVESGKISVSSGNVTSALGFTPTAVGHKHTSSDITDFATEMAKKAEKKHGHTIADIDALKSSLDNKLETSLKGVKNGLATLGSDGKVPSAQLPSYVDDVLEYETKSAFPTKGESGKIYVDMSNNKTYRWSGTAYVLIVGDLALGETSSTAYAGDKGKAVTDALASHKSASNPHGITPSKIGALAVDGKAVNATKADTAGNVTGTVAVANGGTGATTASGARTNLGVGASGTHADDYYALKSHGNHVPATQTANNKVFLRNDNSWHTITPSDIGAQPAGSYATTSDISDMATKTWANGQFLGKSAKASSATVADSAKSVTWGNVSGKPSTFAPASHNHTIANVTNLQTTLDGKVNVANGTVNDSLTINSSTTTGAVKLHFKRGTLEDTYNDWTVTDNAGILEFAPDKGASALSLNPNGTVAVATALTLGGNVVATQTWANSTFATAGHNHDSKYLGKTATAQSALSASKVANSFTVNGVAFNGSAPASVTVPNIDTVTVVPTKVANGAKLTASATLDTTKTKLTINLDVPKGDTGAKGDQGIQGPRGYQGERGLKGDTGAKGDSLAYKWSGTQLGVKVNGSVSDYEYVDLKGAKGDTGATGATGSAGANGTNGKSATITVGTVTSGTSASVTNVGNSLNAKFNFVLPKGDKGDTGVKGDKGLKGDTGPQGPQGIQGKTGPQGKGATNGTQLTTEDLDAYHDEAKCGFYYAGGSNNVQHKPSGMDAFGMWVLRVAQGYYQQEMHSGNSLTNKVFIRTWTGSSWTPWAEKGLKGDKGATGSQGPKGDTGARGATGSQGPKGDTGGRGPAGSNGTNGKDGSNGVSCTHSWNGSKLTLTSASGTTTTDLRGPAGGNGTNGKDGSNGVSCTHSWSGTTLSITSASGTSSANLKGAKGDKGDKGLNGGLTCKTHYAPAQCVNYCTTASSGWTSTYWEKDNNNFWVNGNLLIVAFPSTVGDVYVSIQEVTNASSRQLTPYTYWIEKIAPIPSGCTGVIFY